MVIIHPLHFKEQVEEVEVEQEDQELQVLDHLVEDLIQEELVEQVQQI
jgi:hypothetical protein